MRQPTPLIADTPPIRMAGQGPFVYRLRSGLSGVLVLAGLAFVSLCMIFAADFWMDYRQNPTQFVWRVGVYAGLAFVFSVVAVGLYVTRSQRWWVDGSARPELHIQQWGAFDGAYSLSRVAMATSAAERTRLLLYVDEARTRTIVLAQGTRAEIEHQWSGIKNASAP